MACTAVSYANMRQGIVIALVLVVLLVTPVSVLAQIATTSAPQSINYELPYPGILPDNPLYFFKAARDKLVSILITDPVKKAQFDLLTSDKRVASVQTLVNRSKDDLALSTLSKSNNYLDAAIGAAASAKSQGENSDDVLRNLDLSIQKHGLVVQPIEKQVSKKLLPELLKEERRLMDFRKTVEKLLPK